MARILLVQPAPLASRRGNVITARRWERILRQLGHEVEVAERCQGREANLLVALHARKSAAAVSEWRGRAERKPLVVALTGTDLYVDLCSGGEDRETAHESLRQADRLIVLQRLGVGSLPEDVRDKARVIHQSVELDGLEPDPRQAPPRDDVFQVAVLGHLRAVKDPLLAARAARLLPRTSRVQVVQLGQILEPELEREVARELGENPRYRYLGDKPQAEALWELKRSKLLALTSRAEGGANVIMEAVALDVPVISTRIEGSLGLLGEAYPGYAPVGDIAAFARLLDRAENQPLFWQELQARCREVLPLTQPEGERQAWAELLEELGVAS